MKSKLNQQMLDAMHKDLGNWHGPFYFNPKDPRFSVPKLHPMLGWTLNFANPVSYIALLLILALIIAGTFL